MLLGLCMLFSLLPMTVFAEDVAQTLDEPAAQTLDEPTEEDEYGIAPVTLDKDDNGNGFCDDDQACMHPKDSNCYCTVSGCTHPTSCCPKKTDPQPSVPEFGKEQLAGMQVKVQCETVNGHAKNYHFNELDGCYLTSGVMKDSEGGYHVTVTLDRSSVVAKFNEDEAAGGKTHDDTEPNAITSWTWTWDANDKVWRITAPITDAWATIVVKCEEKQTVQVVIYRNGDTEKAYKTVALEKMPKGTVIDLTKLNIADYYTANYTGKYDFYGWFNDGA